MDEVALRISEHDVRAVLAEPGSTGRAVDAMERAIAAYGRGGFDSPSRVHVDHPGGAGGERSGRALRVLPCIAPDAGGAACRIYTMNKTASAYDAAPCELIVLFDGETMALRALIEDYSLHTLRTAAPTAVAVRHLAPPDVRAVAVIGSGRQARGQLAAVASVVTVGAIRVFSPDCARREAFAAEMTAALGADVVAAETAAEALRGAGVVLVATNTAAPAVELGLVEPGALVVSIAPGELSAELVLASVVVPVSRHEVLEGTPRWEPVPALVASGALAPERLQVELGEIVAGTKALERSPGDRTVVLSTGMAFWDVAIADWVDREARRLGVGAQLWDGSGTRTGTGFVTPRVG